MSPSNNLERLSAYPSFIRYWFARVIGTLANQMLMVALAWQMYDLTNSAWDLGLVGLLQFIPALLLTLPAGHFADRYHRGHIISICILSQAAVAAVLWWGTQEDWVNRELIFALSVILGAARAFQMPAQQAIAPALVKESLLQKAVAMSTSGMQVAIIGGPALGGVIYTAGATAVYGTCTVLLAIGFVLMMFVRYARKRTHQAVSWESVLAGIGFVWHHKILLGAISLDLFAVLLGGATALLPIFARDILHTGPEGLGLLRAAPAVGALVVSLALMRWPLRRKVGYKLLGSVGIFGIGMVVFGLSTSFWLSVAALAVTGAADAISVVTRITLMQLETPDEMRGRVSAVNSIFIGASNQLGEFESGATAALMGPVASVVLGGIGTIAVALGWLRLFPALANRDELAPPRSA
jgi:MFS family permease